MIQTDALAWVVVGLFALTAVTERYRRSLARTVGAGAWVAFAAFWGALFPHFAFGMRSFIEGTLSLLAVPACLYVAYRLYRGREELLVLSRAVAFMGVFYLPFATVAPLRQWLVETVAAQTYLLMAAFGYHPTLETGPPNGYLSQFVFTTGGHAYRTYIVLACTGIGSMAMFAGVIAAVRGTLAQKARALAVALPVIYALNLLRNAFIAVVFGNQYLQVFVPQVQALTGYDRPGLVSFFLADRVISQSLSVVALVLIALLVARELPDVVVVVEELLYLVTGEERDLRPPGRGGDGGPGPTRPTRADGHGSEAGPGTDAGR